MGGVNSITTDVRQAEALSLRPPSTQDLIQEFEEGYIIEPDSQQLIDEIVREDQRQSLKLSPDSLDSTDLASMELIQTILSDAPPSRNESLQKDLASMRLIQKMISQGEIQNDTGLELSHEFQPKAVQPPQASKIHQRKNFVTSTDFLADQDADQIIQAMQNSVIEDMLRQEKCQIPQNTNVQCFTYEQLVELRNAKNPASSVSEFPISTFYPTYLKHFKDCAVCLGTYVEGEQLKTLPCFHSFHADCADDWLSLQNSCPVCQSRVDQLS